MNGCSCPRIWRGGRAGFKLGERRGKRAAAFPKHFGHWAVRLVKTHGVSRTASALGLAYYTLKERAQQTADQPQSSDAAFVELPSSLVVGKQGLFELDNGAGARIRVQLVGYDAADVVALLRNFWNAE